MAALVLIFTPEASWAVVFGASANAASGFPARVHPRTLQSILCKGQGGQPKQTVLQSLQRTTIMDIKHGMGGQCRTCS